MKAFPFDSLRYSYPSRRNLVYGRKGMVATGNALAAQAGLDALKSGGNAMDAAIAAAATLTVVEPVSNGLGSDAFCIIWKNGKLTGINGSGPAPMLASVEALRQKGYTSMPQIGMHTVNVPGAVGVWEEVTAKFGKRTLAQNLEAAISYAQDGYVLQPNVAKEWQGEFKKYQALIAKNQDYQPWADTFAPEGKCLRAGDFLRLPDHAATLRAIAAGGADAFYRGEIAEKIDAHFRRIGGFLRKEDLAAYHPEYVTPLSANYCGYDVWELPPNGHGITVLMALNILKEMEFGAENEFITVHRQIEALKLAYSDAKEYVADPRAMHVTPEEMLSMDYAAERRGLITDKALLPVCGKPKKGGTVYLCTADGEGNMVSYIQSNYCGFGSGVVVPGTGIAFNNRGANFTMDETKDNCIAPGKKSYHTIIPGFLTKDGEAVGPFGIMGGFMQPQAHVQVLNHLLRFGMNPQEALDHPRWMWTGGKTIEVEQSMDNRLCQELLRAGHDIVVKADSSEFGRGEMILRTEDGTLCGACEPRTDAVVAVW